MEQKIKAKRDNYVAQLKQTDEEIANLTGMLKNANIKKEQLRGAIFALDEALTPETPAPTAAEVAVEGMVADAKAGEQPVQAAAKRSKKQTQEKGVQ